MLLSHYLRQDYLDIANICISQIVMVTISPFVLLFLSFGAISAPVESGKSDDDYTTWKSQPNVRGTFGLLLSYLITLSLCIWTAVHLNIPGQLSPSKPPSWLKYIRRRTRWTITGVLAPEMVVYSAWEQWNSARLLTKKMLQLRSKVCRFLAKDKLTDEALGQGRPRFSAAL